MIAPDGRSATYGELTAEAAALAVPLVPVTPKSPAQYRSSAPRRRGRTRARSSRARRSTRSTSTVAGALPTVVVRARRTSAGRSSRGTATAAAALPGVAGVVRIPSGIAVAARTFHEAFRARDALAITWGRGPVRGRSDADIRDTLRRDHACRSRPCCRLRLARRDVRVPVRRARAAGGDERGRRRPERRRRDLVRVAVAELPGRTDRRRDRHPDSNVTMHMPFAGGAFGRHLFGESAIEAAQISQALGRPIKLLWTRNDDMRHGRFRPMTQHCECAPRLARVAMLSFEHRLAAAEMDLRHGYGDALPRAGAQSCTSLIEQVGFNATVSVPYRVRLDEPADRRAALRGADRQLALDLLGLHELRERDLRRPARARAAARTTSSSGSSRTSRRRPRPEALPPAGAAMAQQLGSLDAGRARARRRRPRRVPLGRRLSRRDRRDRPGEPRLARAFAAVDVGMPINPQGLEAQIQGALIDGWSVMFRAGNHLDNGAFARAATATSCGRACTTRRRRRRSTSSRRSARRRARRRRRARPAARRRRLRERLRARDRAQPRRFPIGQEVD